MSARVPDPTCPVPGEPCRKAADAVATAFVRIRAREAARTPVGAVCSGCGERSAVALGGNRRCYQCITGRKTEEDHPRGGGSGPVTMTAPANENRIAEAGELIRRKLDRLDLCPGCRFGFGLRLGIGLARLRGGAE